MGKMERDDLCYGLCLEFCEHFTCDQLGYTSRKQCIIPSYCSCSNCYCQKCRHVIPKIKTHRELSWKELMKQAVFGQKKENFTHSANIYWTPVCHTRHLGYIWEQSRQCFLAMWRLHFSWERYRQKKQENKKMTQYVDAWETVEKSKGLGCGAAHTGCRIKSIDQVDLLRKQEQRLKIRTWVSQADVEGKMF